MTMNLDDLKLKRLCEAKKLQPILTRTTKRLMTDAKGRQVYAEQPGTANKRRGGRSAATTRSAAEDVEPEVEVDVEELDEGAKKHHTPAFVRHCVTAITQRPKDLERVKQDAPGPDEGSPFAICYAKYKGDKRSLAAKHSKGDHHTVAQYEKALATLREETQRARQDNGLDRSAVTFSDVQMEADSSVRHLVRYVPRG